MHKKTPRADNPFRYFSLDDVSKARQELNLSDEQVAKLKQMHHEFRLAQVDRKAEIEKAQIHLNRLRMDRTVSENEVMDAIDDLAQSRAEQSKAQYRFRIQMRAALTPEQLEKWDGLMKEHRQEMRHDFRKRWPGGLGLFNDDDDDWDDADDDEESDDD
jgi:Spy/CpxP family protein refolding chaperone